MIYEGVEWFFKSLGRVFNFALNLNIIGDISALDIFLGMLVIFGLLKFLNFGIENNDGFVTFLQKNVKGNIENAKQKRLDRYESKHSSEYKPEHEKGKKYTGGNPYRSKHGSENRVSNYKRKH